MSRISVSRTTVDSVGHDLHINYYYYYINDNINMELVEYFMYYYTITSYFLRPGLVFILLYIRDYIKKIRDVISVLYYIFRSGNPSRF